MAPVLEELLGEDNMNSFILYGKCCTINLEEQG
jgi:hypothetical protein